MKKNNELDKKIKTKDKTLKAKDKAIKAKDKNEKITKNELDWDYNKELNPKNLCSSIYTECLPIIMEQVKESLTGTGFLCKIPFPDSFTLLPHLLHVIIFYAKKILLKEMKLN